VLTLVSLFLPWQRAPCSTADSFDQSSCGQSIDGWSAVGEVAALSALLLVVLAAVALLRPLLADQLPLGQAALAVAFFTAGVVAQTRLDARQDVVGGRQFGLAYGTYLGIAAALLAVVAAAALRSDELELFPAVRAWPACACGLGLLAVLLLPWTKTALATETSSTSFERLGVAIAPGAIAMALVVRFLAVRSQVERANREALVLAAAVLLFVGGAVAVDRPTTDRSPAWIGLGVAAGMLAFTLADRPGFAVRRSWLAAGLVAGPALLAAGLFAPWERACYSGNQLARLGISGQCVSRNGWELETSVALLLALALVSVLLPLALAELSRTELAVGVALLVATLGFRLDLGDHGGVQVEPAYGAFVGFAAAALLVVLALSGVRVRGVDWSRRATAVPGAALGAAYVAAVVLPWWDVLPSGVWSTFAPGLARLSWMTVAAALLAIRLSYLWATRLSQHTRQADELVVLPLALVALVVLDALRYGLGDLTWNTALLGAFALALVVLGLVERAGGFERVHVPDPLRLDRI